MIGTIFVPEVCFPWKVDLINKFGKNWIKLVFVGENYDAAELGAL